MRRVSKEEALADMAARGFQRAETGCVMCDLVQARGEALRIREDAHAVVMLDRYASTRGNVLVVFREHVEHITNLSLTTHLEVQRLVFEANATLTKVFAPRRIYTATLGSPPASGSTPPAMSFPHLHVHVIPIHEDGETARPAHVFSWSANVWLYDDGEAEELASVLRQAWIGRD